MPANAPPRIAPSPSGAGVGPDQRRPGSAEAMRLASAIVTATATPPAVPPTSTPSFGSVRPAPITAASPSFIPAAMGTPGARPSSKAGPGSRVPILVPGNTSGGSARSSTPAASRALRCAGETLRAGSQNELTASPESRSVRASHDERSQVDAAATSGRSRRSHRAFGSSPRSHPPRPRICASTTSSSAERRSRHISAGPAALPSARTGTSDGPCPSTPIPRTSISSMPRVAASAITSCDVAQIARHQASASCSRGSGPLPVGRRAMAIGAPDSASRSSALTEVLPRSKARSAARTGRRIRCVAARSAWTVAPTVVYIPPGRREDASR